MRVVGLAVVLGLLAAVWIRPVAAVPPGLVLEFDGKGEGKVTFAGARHTGEGMHYSNCHMAIFYVARSAQQLRPLPRRARGAA